MTATPNNEAAGVAYPQGSDREVLLYLMQQFDCETWQCPKCGHAEDTATMDSALYLRDYLAKNPTPAPSARDAEGEALAVDESLLWWLNDAANVMAEMGNDSHVPKLRQIHEALNAHTAASGGEGPPEFVCCEACGTAIEAYCPKCAPPAAVPADALERLVAKWRSDRSDYGHYYIKAALVLCASELAALIPKGADHEKR